MAGSGRALKQELRQGFVAGPSVLTRIRAPGSSVGGLGACDLDYLDFRRAVDCQAGVEPAAAPGKA
jgi:hypothetical protein